MDLSEFYGVLIPVYQLFQGDALSHQESMRISIMIEIEERIKLIAVGFLDLIYREMREG